MKHMTLMIGALLVASSVWATNTPPAATPTQQQGQNQEQGQAQHQGQKQTAQSTSQSTSQSTATGNGGSGGSGGMGGTASATGNGGTGGAATVGDVAAASSNRQTMEYHQIRQAVTGESSGTNTTAACRYDGHAGLGTILGGVSFGRGFKDADCKREGYALSLWSQGRDAAAARVYCQITEVKAALGADCVELVSAQVQPQLPATIVAPPVDLTPFATHAEVEAAFKRSVSK
jgi:hypothetical protein